MIENGKGMSCLWCKEEKKIKEKETTHAIV